MKKDIRGVFIKINRERLGYSLEALSNGICSVSYLSKIEHDEVIASDEIYTLILKKLQLKQPSNQEILELKKLLDEFFHFFFYGDQRCNQLIEKLEKMGEVANSSLYLYYQIFQLYAKKITVTISNDTLLLERYVSYMNDEELFLYQLYKGLNGQDCNLMYDDYRQLYIWKAKGNIALEEKKYLLAYDNYQYAYQIACRVGNTICMADILMSLGYVSSYLDIGAMQAYYEKAVILNKRVKSLAYYNIAMILMIQDSSVNSIERYLKKGLQVCNDRNFQDKIQQGLFIYYSIKKEIDKKREIYKQLNNSNLMLDIMYKYDNFDDNENYIKFVYQQRNDSRIYAYLYERNCKIHKRYKEIYLFKKSKTSV